MNHPSNSTSFDDGLKRIVARLSQKITRDTLVQRTTQELRQSLQVDRLLLYYFYRKWEGQVTFEALSSEDLSIFGSSGPADCFNYEYADLYLAGRVRAIPDIEQEAIADCHRDFLRNLKVRANLVVPILTHQGLWGLLVAHHCQSERLWSESDIEHMQEAANVLATAESIRGY